MLYEWYDIVDEEGETPMTRALKSGHFALANLMVRIEKVEQPPTEDGEAVLHRAAYWGLEHAVRKLLAAGHNPCVPDRRGETPLHKAARRGHYETLEALVEDGADVNVRDDNGMTVLHWVALNGRADMAELLVSAGADVNARDLATGGLTPLAVAKLMGYEDLAEQLAGNGATW